MSKQKIVIADSGATKTDWSLVQHGEVLQQFSTEGISPIFQTENQKRRNRFFRNAP